MKWPRTREGPGRLPSLGQDYDAAHRSYVEQVGESGMRWLRTKPFNAPPNYELATCLRTFSHIIEQLRLGPRAQVLDVGCGPGWLSEYLARCGYIVVGIDISEDMVQIARERVAAIESPIGEGLEPMAEFHAMPVRELPWEGRFDAAILYDTLHHFDDELETLKTIRRTLVPGGRIYVREGVIPDPDSEAEHGLIEEMETYGTLESPFDPRYLEQVVREAGFTDIHRFFEVDALFDLSDMSGLFRTVKRYAALRLGVRKPDTNTLLAINPIPHELELEEGAVAGRIEPAGSFRATDGGRTLAVHAVVRNTGRSSWPSSADFPFVQGTVTVGPYVGRPGRRRTELARTTLPRSISPGEEVAVQIRVSADQAGDAGQITLELVWEGFHWFSELGSEPVVVPVEGRS